ncbi:Uncharacterised protein [Streptococcus acidominimus]|uniref:Uncharacterized protein n=1 Tax=Streptococcus acidominimus TaxID=1326 RepID=A0A380IHQ9_STRAI|nr:Uncharacterised protein [Streptococcus acidominimus]
MFHKHEEIYLFYTALSPCSIIKYEAIKKATENRKYDEEASESLLRKLLSSAFKGMLYL